MEEGHDMIKILLNVLIISSVLYLYSSFVSLQTTLCLLTIGGALIGLLALKWSKVRQHGALNKLSKKFIVLMLERSIFDILCDIWYFGVLRRTLKAIIMPFIFKADPSEVIKSFDDLPPSLKQVILRKGLINLLPNFVKEELTHNYIIEQPQVEAEEQKQMDPQQEDQQKIEARNQNNLIIVSQGVADDNSTNSVSLQSSEIAQQNEQQPRNDQMIVEYKKHQLENVNNTVLTTHWDQFDEYKKYVIKRQQQIDGSDAKLSRKPKHLMNLIKLVFRGKFDNSILLKQSDLLRNAKKLNKEAWGCLVASMLIMAIHYYGMKSSRKIYKNTFLIMICLALLSFTGFSVGLVYTTKNKKSEIEQNIHQNARAIHE